tara:strand:- start:14 stop:256 length:243 start_codon:yes stop_codon:yes gene_type:complete
MQYYLMAPGDTEQDAMNEANLLGEASFNNFWGGAALQVLMRLVEAEPEVLEILKIVNEKGKTMTVAEFLEQIQPLKVIMR